MTPPRAVFAIASGQRGLRSNRQQDLVRFIAKSGLVDLDTLVNRFFREENEMLLDAKPRALQALQRLALQEYLQVRPVVLDAVDVVRKQQLGALGSFVGKHYFVLAYCITPRAARDFNAPLPPTLRANFVQHHIKTLEAIVAVEKEYRAGAERVVDFKMESQLIRENFQGKVFDGNQDIIPKFPDALLVVRGSDGALRNINVEYVTGKYTNEMIAEKQQSFSGETIWVADRPATAARIADVTGQPARIY